jgi:hypothetical protein
MDDISFDFPGKADYKTIVENGTRVQKQKRMVLCNLTEAHRKYLGEKCSLRPENVFSLDQKEHIPGVFVVVIKTLN